MATVGTRVFNAYGKGEHKKGAASSPIAKFIDYKKKGEDIVIFDDGQKTGDFVHVKDVARITVGLFERAESGIYNIGTGIATTYNELAEIIGGNKKYVKNPFASIAISTTASKRADTGKLFGFLGGTYKFIDLREGIEKTMRP